MVACISIMGKSYYGLNPRHGMNGVIWLPWIGVCIRNAYHSFRNYTNFMRTPA